MDSFSKLQWKDVNGQWMEFDNSGQTKHFEANFLGGLCFIIKAEKCFLVKEDINILRDQQEFEIKKDELLAERKGLKEEYKHLEIKMLSGLMDNKTFIIEKQKIRKRAKEIRNTLGPSNYLEDFKI